MEMSEVSVAGKRGLAPCPHSSVCSARGMRRISPLGLDTSRYCGDRAVQVSVGLQASCPDDTWCRHWCMRVRSMLHRPGLSIAGRRAAVLKTCGRARRAATCSIGAPGVPRATGRMS